MTSNVSVILSGDGSTRAFDVPFIYLRKRYVRAAVDGQPVNFSWINASRIEFDVAPEAGSIVRLWRDTPSLPIHDLKDNVPTPANTYKELTTQALHYAEERRAGPEELQLLRDEALAAAGGANLALSEANDAAARARADAAAAALYGVPEVSTVADLHGITPSTLDVGDLVRVSSTGAVYERVATGGTFDFTATGGVRLRVVTNVDTRLSDYGGDIRSMLKNGGGVMDQDVAVDGVLETGPNMRLQLNPGQVLKQTKRSVVGAFLTNVVMGSDAGRLQSNLFVEGGIISAEDYPAGEEYAAVTIGATAIRLPNTASSIPDYYKGMMVQLMSGGSPGNWWTRVVSAYNSTTKVITMSEALTGPMIPAAGSVVRLGFNDNGAGGAWGSENVRLTDITIRDYEMRKMAPVVLGAKAVNFEQGAKDAVMRGLTLKNCGTGLYLNAHLGKHRNDGYPKWVQAIRATELHFEDCSSAISAGILDGVAGIPDDPALLQAVIANSTYHNCGHAPWRITGSDPQKSGVLNLMGANGLSVSNIRGYNDADYVEKAGGYPTDYPARSGFGLSGPIGAVIWGHARATSISDWHHYGDADKAVHIGRVRSMGDDAPPSGVVSQLIGWNINGLYVYGTVNQIVGRDNVTGFHAAQITGHWRIAVNAANMLLDPGLSPGTAWTLELTEIPTGKTVIGTAAQILARGNTFADYPAGTTDLRGTNARVITLADDEAVRIVPPKNRGIMKVMAAGTAGGATGAAFAIAYHTFGAAVCEALYGAPIVSTGAALTTGATTGTDAQWNVAAVVSDALYLKNRRGGSRTVEIRFE